MSNFDKIVKIVKIVKMYQNRDIKFVKIVKNVSKSVNSEGIAFSKTNQVCLELTSPYRLFGIFDNPALY